jgi:hypothetical protein
MAIEELAYFNIRSVFLMRHWETASDYDSWIGGRTVGWQEVDRVWGQDLQYKL